MHKQNWYTKARNSQHRYSMDISSMPRLSMNTARQRKPWYSIFRMIKHWHRRY